MSVTKAELKRICKNILHKYPVGTRLNEADQSFLISVFENHREWEQKFGCGIDYITTMKAKMGTTCFSIFRIDGSNTDISYPTAIDGKTPQSDIKRACRFAIEPIISKFKVENVFFGKTVCPFTNEVLYTSNTHIDHYDKTFDEVFKLWIADKSIDELSKKINATTDGSFDTFFTDESIVSDFIAFHDLHTHLRAVSRTANLSILRKKT